MGSVRATWGAVLSSSFTSSLCLVIFHVARCVPGVWSRSEHSHSWVRGRVAFKVQLLKKPHEGDEHNYIPLAFRCLCGWRG